MKGIERIQSWLFAHKLQTGVTAAIVIVAIIVAIVVGSGAFSTSTQQPEQQRAKTVEVTLNVAANNGWDMSSTPAIVHIEGNDVNFFHAVTPDAEGNKGTSTVALAEGDYTVSFVSPVNSDGSTFEMNEAGAAGDVVVDADNETVPVVECHMMQIPADQVTDEMLQNIIEQTKDAIENGDETLKGDAGISILDKLESNVAQNSNATNETKQESTDADKEVDVNDEPSQTTPPATTGSNNSGSQPSDTGSPSTSTGNSGDNGTSSTQSTQPAHTHSWVNHTATRQVWVSNWVDVPDYETRVISGGQLYTKQSDGTWLGNGATYWFYTDADFQAFKNLIVEKMKTEGYTGNYVNRTKTENVQVGSHKEDQGHYESETYVDYVYCSSCGARQ